jgi:hypothetical protein
MNKIRSGSRAFTFSTTLASRREKYDPAKDNDIEGGQGIILK